MDKFILVNDFQCAGYALNGLRPVDLVCCRPGSKSDGAVKVLIGVGTGLGMTFSMESNGTYRPFASESGWVHFWEITDFDRKLAEHLRESTDSDTISFEQVCSGPALVKLCEIVAEADGQIPLHRSPKAICAAYISCRYARQAADLMLEYLGRYICQMSLVYKPTGGVYLTGGAMDSLFPLIARSGSFENGLNAQTHPILRNITKCPSIYYVRKPDIGMWGARELSILVHNGQSNKEV